MHQHCCRSLLRLRRHASAKPSPAHPANLSGVCNSRSRHPLPFHALSIEPRNLRFSRGNNASTCCVWCARPCRSRPRRRTNRPPDWLLLRVRDSNPRGLFLPRPNRPRHSGDGTKRDQTTGQTVPTRKRQATTTFVFFLQPIFIRRQRMQAPTAASSRHKSHLALVAASAGTNCDRVVVN